MKRIAVLPGDGIGPEVTAQALRVLKEVAPDMETDVLGHVNADTYLATGTALGDEDFARVADSDGALLGAVGDPRVTNPAYARDVLLRLRFDLDLYVNHRPAKLLHERLSPLRDPDRRAIDCTVIRENTEGLYSGIGGTLRVGTPHETAVDTELSTYRGVSRALEFAFARATTSVCLVDKANAVPNNGALWQRCFREAAQRRPDLATRHLYVDAAVMHLVDDPTAFDVIVANNSHGDILSDLTAQLAGGMGTAASANLNPETGFALCEPVHGSAPDLAGTGTANPLAAILSAALLLDCASRPAEATAVRDAVGRTLSKRLCTADLGGSLTTAEAGNAVLAELS
ncbi:isocitrate/isopropylmalate dehydrogenase family protein [Streptomyces sp. NBC_01408]|uniref:isocitrate/isopropylmalate dehydrogenase family protein n=1 Tax=Streptomyces sp. NBC_01408 TaxID=2903855 RepID=UPI002254DF74|nr:isocitrate/isopropylmalate family dehydrogenase [Streptomyces sp. NBC_01408]MCX4692898.1 isocitrate/isopropylmalate family dehydrogenase [Streptomyces sp. NBC_01408]